MIPYYLQKIRRVRIPPKTKKQSGAVHVSLALSVRTRMFLQKCHIPYLTPRRPIPTTNGHHGILPLVCKRLPIRTPLPKKPVRRRSHSSWGIGPIVTNADKRFLVTTVILYVLRSIFSLLGLLWQCSMWHYVYFTKCSVGFR